MDLGISKTCSASLMIFALKDSQDKLVKLQIRISLFQLCKAGAGQMLDPRGWNKPHIYCNTQHNSETSNTVFMRLPPMSDDLQIPLPCIECWHSKYSLQSSLPDGIFMPRGLASRRSPHSTAHPGTCVSVNEYDVSTSLWVWV